MIDVTPPLPVRTSQSVNREKWSYGLLKAGWVLLPNVIIEKQKELGLDPVDLNIVLHLAVHWWTKDVLPCPSKARLAAAMQLSPRTLQRRLTALHKRGLVTRIERGSQTNKMTNEYDLTGLIEKARPLAEEVDYKRAANKRKKGSPPGGAAL